DCARCLDELAGGSKCAAGGEQVVDHKHARSRGEAVHVELQLGAAVFQVVLQTMGAVRELARLAERNKRLLHGQSQGSGKKKPARFRGRDHIDGLTPVMVREAVNGLLKSRRVRQKRCDVLEKDARLGKIRDVAYKMCQVHTKNFTESARQGNMTIQVRRATAADIDHVCEFNRLLALESEGKTLDA